MNQPVRPGAVMALLFFFAFLQTGCGTATTSVSASGPRPLAGKTICLVMEFGAGANSTTSVGVIGGGATASGSPNTATAGGIGGGLGVRHAMDGKEQAVLAAKDLELELRAAGVRVVTNRDSATVLANFYIGTCRYDPVGGWIADKSFIDFRDAMTGETLALVKGEIRLVTPTIRSHIRSLVEATKQLL